MAVQSSPPFLEDLELRVYKSDGSLAKNDELERLHKTCREQSRQIATLHMHVEDQLLELEKLRSEKEALAMQVKELQTSCRPAAEQLQRSERGSLGLKRRVEEELKATDELLIECNLRLREVERSVAQQRKENEALRNQVATHELQEAQVRTRCQELEDLVKSKDELILAFERVLNTKLESDVKVLTVCATAKSLAHKQKLWPSGRAIGRMSCFHRSRLRNRRCLLSQPCQRASFVNIKQAGEADCKLKQSRFHKSFSMPLSHRAWAGIYETVDNLEGDDANDASALDTNDDLVAPLSACGGG